MTRQQKLTPHFERGECREKKESLQISRLGLQVLGRAKSSKHFSSFSFYTPSAPSFVQYHSFSSVVPFSVNEASSSMYSVKWP
jgi:hypothetical protein